MLLWLPTRHPAAFLLTRYVLIVVPGPCGITLIALGMALAVAAATGSA